MSNEFEKIGGIYFRKDQIETAIYGGGLNGSHSVTLKNGSIFVFEQQPKGKYPDYVLDGMPAERPSIEVQEDGKVWINQCDIAQINNCEGKKDFYAIHDSKVGKLNLEEQDAYILLSDSKIGK